MSVNYDDNKEPKANAAMGEALRAAQEQGGVFNRHDNRDGLLYRFGAENANPELQGMKKLDKLCSRIEQILNNAAATMGGCPTHNAKKETITRYDDFFEKGHSEEYQLGNLTLLIEVKFTLPGNLKLVIKNLEVPRPTQNIEGMGFKVTETGPRTFSIDKAVGLRFDPNRQSSFGPKVTLLPDNEHFVNSVFMPLAKFSDANGLAFYLQGMATDSITYVFLDQE